MKTIGFISPPAWFDPAPSEFPEVVQEDVRTQQTPILLPKFDYQLDTIAQVGEHLSLCGESLKAIGCDLIAQVGSPFSWARIHSEQDARSRQQAIAEKTGLPSVMTGLSIIDALRALGCNKVAASCTYYDDEWTDCFARFLSLCGFDVIEKANFLTQNIAPQGSTFAELGWMQDNDMTCTSVLQLSEACPEADAIVVTGAGTRTLALLTELEEIAKKPIVAADTALYWAIAKQLRLPLRPSMGLLASI